MSTHDTDALTVVSSENVKLYGIIASIRSAVAAGRQVPCLEAEDLQLLADTAQDALELRRSFDLRWKTDMIAINKWEASAHGRRQVLWPDHTDLCLWLLDQLDAAGELPTRRKPSNVRFWLGVIGLGFAAAWFWLQDVIAFSSRRREP